MEALSGVFAAFGLSASAGLNAYIPLLVVALVAKYTNLITLSSPWDALTSWWVIGVLFVLLVIEFFVDKAPVANHVNDGIQTFIRPVAGAIVFAGSAQVITDIHPILAMILGILISGTVHVAKTAAVRPAVTLTTGGLANTPVSIAEDIIAAMISILAIIIPVLIGTFAIIATSYIVWRMWRRDDPEEVY